MLMRNGDVPERVTQLMAGFRDATESARDLTGLMGIEGSAAALYFEQFESMLKQREGWKFDWRGRNRRPPRDPVNALLSLGYKMAYRRMLEVQARQLWRFVRGEALAYHGFVTR
jgi:CRISPR-associated protein Cas1